MRADLFREDYSLLSSPWLLELYFLCQANPLFRVGTFERTRLFCVAVERLAGELKPWELEYVLARVHGHTIQDSVVRAAAQARCSTRTIYRRLEAA